MRDLDAFLSAVEVEVVAFDEEQAQVARDASQGFGKGRHRANLNFGDCAAYALASVRAEPLLCGGDDSSQTDLPGVEIGP